MIKFNWETEFKKTEIGEIPREWEVKKIKEVGEIAGGTTPSTKKKEYWDGRIPWLTPKDLRDYEYVYISRGERNITEKAVKECSLKFFPEGTVLLTTRAPIGYVAIAKNRITANQGFRNIVPHKIKSEYLYYYLKNVTDYLKSLAGGSTFGELTGTTLKEVLIPYPPPEEQSRIATVLSWFDDLIENKKRQNEILEKVAMAIFKSWFVDFEPFKDEEFGYSEELGKEIPMGWEVDFATRLIDYNPSIRLEKEEVYPFVEMKQVYTNSAVCEFSFRKFNGSGVKYYGGDTLMARITPSLEHGKTAFVWFISENEKGFGTTEFFVLHPKKSWLKEFIYLLAKNEDFRDTAINSMTGTSGRQRADVEALKSYLIPIPPPLIFQKFHSLVEPLFQKIILNQKQTMILRKIRDTLLPKLVFGKLRVEVLR